MEAARLLKKSELFSTLEDEDLAFIATRTEALAFSSGDFVFQAGGAAIHFYVVMAGEVAVFRSPAEGERQDLARYVSGESFGEYVFITGGLHDVEARAETDATLLVFPAFPHTLESISQERPDVIMRIYRRSIAVLSDRLQSIHALIAENSAWIKALQEQISVDRLTGLFTRSYLDSELVHLVRPPAVLMIVKPDRFKELNEIFGHKAGDAVLARIGAALIELTDNRPGWALRLRSNETAVLLQSDDLPRALDFARTLAFTISDSGPKWNAESGGERRVTLSIAVGVYAEKNWPAFFDSVYRLLRTAWKRGGNRIVCLGGGDRADEPGKKRENRRT